MYWPISEVSLANPVSRTKAGGVLFFCKFVTIFKMLTLEKLTIVMKRAETIVFLFCWWGEVLFCDDDLPPDSFFML